MKSDKILQDVALLATRVALGSSIAAHGAQKMFGAFDGPGLEGAAKFMNSIGFRPGGKYAKASAAAEMAAGTLIVLGVFGPAGPAILAATMIVAAETVHRRNGFFQTKNGVELNMAYFLLALLLANAGNGSISLDAVLRLDKKFKPTFGWLVMAGGVAGALAMLSKRETKPPSGQTVRVETGTTEGAKTS